MEELLKHFKTQAAISRALGISNEAVCQAFKREKLPQNWIPKLKAAGVTTSMLKRIPFSGSGNQTIASLTKG